jgi:hypothetical protein
MLLTPYLLSICIYNVEEVEMNWVHSSRKKKMTGHVTHCGNSNIIIFVVIIY